MDGSASGWSDRFPRQTLGIENCARTLAHRARGRERQRGGESATKKEESRVELSISVITVVFGRELHRFDDFIISGRAFHPTSSSSSFPPSLHDEELGRRFFSLYRRMKGREEKEKVILEVAASEFVDFEIGSV